MNDATKAPERIWAGTYDDRSSDNEDEWCLNVPYWREDNRDPQFAAPYILATPTALAASPEVAALIREAEARGMERAAEAGQEIADAAHANAMTEKPGSKARNDMMERCWGAEDAVRAIRALADPTGVEALAKLRKAANAANEHWLAKLDAEAERDAALARLAETEGKLGRCGRR